MIITNIRSFTSQQSFIHNEIIILHYIHWCQTSGQKNNNHEEP